MLSAVVPLGFMGLHPDGQTLRIEPNLPKDCPEMTVRNLLYQGTRMDITVSNEQLRVNVRSVPSTRIRVCFKGVENQMDSSGEYRW